MRGFRSDRKNLADARIAYTLLAWITLAAVILGWLAVRAAADLRTAELHTLRGTMAECADSLRTWLDADDAEMRLASALRFRSAAARLPDAIDREPLFRLADQLRAEAASDADVRALADAFALHAAYSYPHAQAALTALHSALEPLFPAQADSPVETEIIRERTEYSRTVAVHAVKKLFGDQVDCRLSEDGLSWVAETENLRIRFSGFDGSLESFIYIRLGAAPSIRCTDSELVERAVRFADRLGLGATGGSIADRLCGYTAVLIDGKAADYRVVLDPAGRVWSMLKVKR